MTTRVNSNGFIFLMLWLSLGLVACDKAPTPPEEPLQGKLVFFTADSTVGAASLYTMNEDGSELRPIAVVGDTIWWTPSQPYVVKHPSYFTNPRWSPDGKQIACGYEYGFDYSELVIMNADGSRKRRIPLNYGEARQPQWSPNGNQILYFRGVASFFGGPAIINADGSNDYDLPDHDSPYLFEGDSLWLGGDFQWGPDSNLLYTSALVNRIPPPTKFQGCCPEREIFSVDSQTGKILKRLTYNKYDEFGFQLSPDGQKVAFRAADNINENVRFALLSWRSNALLEIPAGDIWAWNWASDGEKIVFTLNEIQVPGDVHTYLYLVEIARPTMLRKLATFEAGEPDLFVPND